MAKHAKLCPPSGWDRWSNCSASVDLQTNEGSEFAAEGTAAHLLADTCHRQGNKPADYIGSNIWVPDAEDEDAGERERFLDDDHEAPLTGWVFEVDKSMAGYVQEYLDQVYMQPADYLQSETAVPIDHITGEEDAEGHADFIRVHGKTLATHDLKYGQGVKVYAEDNGQQVHYLSGARRAMEWMDDFEHFEVHIHQPRLGHHDVWTLTKAELIAWEKKINEKAYPIVIEGVREFGPDTKGCKFCDNRRTCAARDAIAMASPDDFPDDPAELGVEPDLGDYMAAVLDRIEFVEAWIKDMWARANDMVKDDPDAIPGWGLYPGRGSRKINDEAKVKSKLKGLKYKLDDYAPRKMCSAAQLEKLVGKEVYTEKFSEFVTHTEGTPKLGRSKGNRKSSRQKDLAAFGDE